MKVLFCGLKYEYGKVEAGPSFEYQNFFEVLKRMDGVEAEIFAVDEVMQSIGRDEMNRRLINTVLETAPDLLFCFLFTDSYERIRLGDRLFLTPKVLTCDTIGIIDSTIR